MRISYEEIETLEYLFFSLNEEIDIFYCKHTHKQVFEKEYEIDSLRDRLLYLIDTIENKS
jgi:hypothetical protein